MCVGFTKENWFDRGIQWKVCVGYKIKFWVDEWVERECLTLIFKIIPHFETKEGGCREYGVLEEKLLVLGFGVEKRYF